MSPESGNINIAGTRIIREMKRLREEKRLTKSDLAKESRLTYRTIHDLEEGRRNSIQEKTLLSLADALGVESDFLLSSVLQKKAYGQIFGSAGEHKINTGRMVLPLVISLFLIVSVFGLWRRAVTKPDFYFNGNILVAKEKFLGTTLWTYQTSNCFVDVIIAPWSDHELIAGMSQFNGKHGQILCLERSTGEIKWSRTLDIEALIRAFGEETVMKAPFSVNALVPSDVDGNGEPELVAGFIHGIWYPYAICLFDSEGKLLHQYNSLGHVTGIVCEDLNGNGKDEVVCFGTNNTHSYQAAQITILDVTHFDGASVDPYANPASQAEDHSLYRVLLPIYPRPIQDMVHGLRLAATTFSICSDSDGNPIFQFLIGNTESELVLVDFDSQFRPIRSEVSEVFRSIISTWPDSLTNNTGITNDAWRADWLSGYYRFESGTLVHGDTLMAAIPRYSE